MLRGPRAAWRQYSRGLSRPRWNPGRHPVKLIAVVIVLILVAGCDANPVAPTAPIAPLDVSELYRGFGPTISSVAPASAVAGTTGLTLTVTGTNFFYQPPSGSHTTTWLSWRANGLTTHLWSETTVVSATELRIQVPESLVRQIGPARLRVENGDSMNVSDGA